MTAIKTFNQLMLPVRKVYIRLQFIMRLKLLMCNSVMDAISAGQSYLRVQKLLKSLERC